MTQNNQDLIRQEIEKLISEAKESLKEVKHFAVSEAWKILQLLIASVIQIIEKFGSDLASPAKKILALELISDFYDKIFIKIDIPWVPELVEATLRIQIKAFIMALVSSAIDSMVATFRDIGIFKKKKVVEVSNIEQSEIVVNFINNIQDIARSSQ